ncbi:MAG TPA: GAF domain-containing protein, partial [Herpetosiphonaceae bacterium]
LEAVSEVNHALCQGLQLDYCSLALMDECGDLQHYGVTCAPGHQGRRPRIQAALEPLMAGLHGQQLWVAGDVADDPRVTPALLDTLRRCEIRSAVWAPVKIEDEWLGVLCAYSFGQPRDWTDDDIRLLTDIADQISLACRQMRLYEAERQRRRELEALQDIIGSIGGELSLSALCQKVVRKVVDVFALPAAAVVLRGAEGLEVIASHGLAEETIASQPISSANVRELLRRFPPPAAMSITNLPAAGGGAEHQSLDGGWSLLGQPLLVDGVFSGWLQLYSDEPARAWTPQEVHLAAAMAKQVAQAIHAARLYEKEHLLRTDAQEAYYHLREVLEELDSTREQLIRSEKLRSLGELASGVAHDFNNLLASILGNAQLLLGDERSVERKTALQVIEQAARDGAVTVRRIQEFARSSETVYEDVVDLREIVEMALEFSRPSWRDAAQQRGAIIEIEQRCESVHVLGSAAELREVVVNLIVNAADAMPHGGTIALLTGSEDERALLSVADSGAGISPENRARIFDPFFTTKPIGEGTGLGLAVALSIVQRHRGSLRVEDREPRGAQFVAVFPRHMPTPPPAPTAAPGNPAGAAQRILVVDDEPAIRKVVARVLERDGHLVTLAESAEAALPLLEGTRYDIIISDLGMPGMNGWDFLDLARQRHPGVGTILLTGWGYQLDHDQSPNVDIILAKPFEMQTIRSTIAAMTAATSRG